MSGVAVVGAGYWGKNLVRNFHELGALAAVAEPQPELRQKVEDSYGVRVYASHQEAFAAETPAVALATPAPTHYPLALEALRAGKDVFVEKPLALTAEQGMTLVKEARKHKRILMVGHVLEYHPAVVKLLELVHSGELGKLRYIYSNRLSLGKIRREENILWSFAPHDVAVMLRITGAMPFQVIACGGSYLQANIADTTMTNLLFDNGVRAHIYVSWLHPFKEQRLVLIGDRKMASFDDVNKKLLLYDQRVEIEAGEPVPVKGEGIEVPFAGGEPLKLECQAFLDAVATRKAPLTDGESGVRVLKVLEAAQRSLITNGTPTPLPIEAV